MLNLKEIRSLKQQCKEAERNKKALADLQDIAISRKLAELDEKLMQQVVADRKSRKRQREPIEPLQRGKRLSSVVEQSAEDGSTSESDENQRLDD